MVANDRREFQRLRLAKPILALMDGQSALILDIGIAGAYIEHYGALPPGARFKLLFRWQRADVELLCEVRRARVVRSGGDNMSVVSHSGVQFVEAIGDADARLNDMMATFVGRVLAAQRANASGKPEEGEALSLAQLGGARRARTRGWVSFRLVNGTWRRALLTSSQLSTYYVGYALRVRSPSTSATRLSLLRAACSGVWSTTSS